MKRTKLFLGLTTCVLAVAGVAASKAAKFTNAVTRYYCTKQNFQKCVTVQALCNEPTNSLTCTIILPVGGQNVRYTLYTLNPGFTVDGCGISTPTIKPKCSSVNVAHKPISD